MSLHQITCFLAVAEDLNFSRAAKRPSPVAAAPDASNSGHRKRARWPTVLSNAHGVRLTPAGVQPVSLASWKTASHLTLNAAYERFGCDDFIRLIPTTRSISYVAVWANFRF
jgi:hypothetical protein